MMARVWAPPQDDGERRRSARDLFEAFVLPSRAAVLASLRAALEAQEGPALVTGEAGVGKTWLWRRLRADRPASWHWVDVDLSPTDDPADFYRAIGHALGQIGAGGTSPSRLDLADSLVQAHVEGRRWVLVVDEAHNLSAGVLEEIRLQSNRLGRPGGFAGLVLVGQTPLVRRLATRSLAALEARLSARAHLRTLDIEEARVLLGHLERGTSGDEEEFERLHRDAGGSPRRLILRSARQAAPLGPSPRPVAPPLLGPSRPPLRLEDGLIEVGWDAEGGSTESVPPREAAHLVGPGDDGTEGHGGCEHETESGPQAEVEEAIDDPYTAIQGWSDLERNHERDEEPLGLVSDPAPSVAVPRETGAASWPNVWAEGHHEFAPYSHLFSRLRQPRESP